MIFITDLFLSFRTIHIFPQKINKIINYFDQMKWINFLFRFDRFLHQRNKIREENNSFMNGFVNIFRYAHVYHPSMMKLYKIIIIYWWSDFFYKKNNLRAYRNNEKEQTKIYQNNLQYLRVFFFFFLLSLSLAESNTFK